MQINAQKQFSALLRAAATQQIAEDDFWNQFNSLVDPENDDIAGLALESATHYWGNFHQRNLLFIPAKPDAGQLQQGRDELNLIADAIDGNWPLPELERRLKDI